jgi:hypothetical protein
MKHASTQLLNSKNPRENAVGAYIWGLIDKASFKGVGFTKKYRRELGNTRRTDPMILDQFRISAGDPDYDSVMAPRANF